MQEGLGFRVRFESVGLAVKGSSAPTVYPKP